MRARSALFKKKIPEAVADIFIITNPHNFINNYCDCWIWLSFSLINRSISLIVLGGGGEGEGETPFCPWKDLVLMFLTCSFHSSQHQLFHDPRPSSSAQRSWAFPLLRSREDCMGKQCDSDTWPQIILQHQMFITSSPEMTLDCGWNAALRASQSVPT